MTICNHDFHDLGPATKMPTSEQQRTSSVAWRSTPGIEVICVLCGQVRKAFADGTVRVSVVGNAPLDEDHVDTD